MTIPGKRISYRAVIVTKKVPIAVKPGDTPCRSKASAELQNRNDRSDFISLVETDREWYNNKDMIRSVSVWISLNLYRISILPETSQRL